MENWDFQVKKEEYNRLHDRVWSSSNESRYRQITYDLLIEEECMIRYNQDDTRISTNCSTRNIEIIEDGNNISRIRIWVYGKMT